MFHGIGDKINEVFKVGVYSLLQWSMPKLEKENIMGMAADVAVKMAQGYQDKMGLSHCVLCPSRFGLSYKTVALKNGGTRNVMLCDRCYPNVKEASQLKTNG